MANNKTRTSSSKRKTNTKSNTKKRRRTKKQTQIYRENTIFIVVSLLCLLLMISVLGHGSKAGEFFRNLQFGFVGLLAYIFPILLFAVSVYLYVGRKKKDKYARTLVYVILFVSICFLAQLLSGDYSIGGGTAQAITYSQEHHLGGGLIGGGLESLIRGIFGLIGAYLIDIAVIILCLVYLTGKSFVAGVGRGTARAYNKAYTKTKENIEYQKEQYSKRKEEERNLRMNHKVSGVSYNTKLDNGMVNLSDQDDDHTFKAGSNSLGKEKTPKMLNTFETQKVKESQNAIRDISPDVSQMQEMAEENMDEFFPDYLQKEVDTMAAYETEGINFRDSYAEETFTEESASDVPEYLADYEEPEITEEDPRAVLKELARPAATSASAKSASALSKPTSSTENLSSATKTGGLAAASTGIAAASAESKANSADEEIEISDNQPEVEEYIFPSIELLAKPAAGNGSKDPSAYQNQLKLQETMKSFGVNVTVTGFQQGPTVTRYELLPAAGVKVSKILSLSDDLKLALAAADIRIEAPIPGKSAIGIEVPNKKRVTVSLRELIDTNAFAEHKSKIAFAAGKDINGNVILADIQKMPHLLIAGATGSGKSVCINTIIMSILYKARPDEVKLIMIDPKVVELSVYNGIPHLLTPVVTDPKKAAGALNWAVSEMTRRYQLFAAEGVRDIKAYNAKARKANAEKEAIVDILPQVVIIVDELADLMMVAPSEVEDAICRLAQLARAAGLHLVIATQRPSVNVITGLIKANMPSRIAFSVSSGVDSRTILDTNGAEKLLGNGDMLYYPQGLSKPLRVQGAFVSDDEVSAVVEAIKENNEKPEYNEEISTHEVSSGGSASSGSTDAGEERDELFEQAGRFLIEANKGSIGSLQRKFRIGFNRAARIVDQLEEAMVLGPEEGTKPRQILMTIEEFECLITGGNEGEDET
jgi:DNA segregation ATPase FtsK/SpoIIIE, S-DNA-T family